MNQGTWPLAWKTIRGHLNARGARNSTNPCKGLTRALGTLQSQAHWDAAGLLCFPVAGSAGQGRHLGYPVWTPHGAAGTAGEVSEQPAASRVPDCAPTQTNPNSGNSRSELPLSGHRHKDWHGQRAVALVPFVLGTYPLRLPWGSHKVAGQSRTSLAGA